MVRSAAEGIKTGRPFAIPKSLQGEMDAGLKKALRLGGASDKEAKQLIGLSKSNPGLSPTQRVLFARQWDEVIRPLQGVDNKEAKRLAGKLTKDVRSSVTDIRQSLQKDIQAKLNAIDPNVQKMLGGRSAWQVMADKIKRTNPDTETLEAMKDALDVLPEDQIPRFIRQLTDSRARRGARAVEELRAASMLARFGTHFRNIGTTVLNIGTQVP
ncbi:MAG: hypothetical protein ACXAEN_27175, partial [Candidatus Thorarchaeota archaeon]